MIVADAEVDELKEAYPGVKVGTEAGVIYYLIEGLSLPERCVPVASDVLFCPSPREGYPSRLFTAGQIDGPFRSKPNWTATNLRILERNWFAYSWKVREGMRLLPTLRAHLDAFR